MMGRVRFKFLAGVIAFPMAVGACGPSDSARECSLSCQFWLNCIDNTLDVDGCVDDCEARSTADADFADDVAACDTCIVDNVRATCRDAETCQGVCRIVVEPSES